MSRSRRKTPNFGHTSAEIDAEWKAQSARLLRRRVTQVLKATLDITIFPGKRWDLVNPWSAPKDGKHWWRGPGREICVSDSAIWLFLGFSLIQLFKKIESH